MKRFLLIKVPALCLAAALLIAPGLGSAAPFCHESLPGHHAAQAEVGHAHSGDYPNGLMAGKSPDICCARQGAVSDLIVLTPQSSDPRKFQESGRFHCASTGSQLSSLSATIRHVPKYIPGAAPPKTDLHCSYLI